MAHTANLAWWCMTMSRADRYGILMKFGYWKCNFVSCGDIEVALWKDYFNRYSLYVVFACLGFLSPPNRGALMTAVLVGPRGCDMF